MIREADTAAEQIRSALASDPRIKTHPGSFRFEMKDGHLLLNGEVESIAEKRLVAELAKNVVGDLNINDQLQVATPEPRDDDQLSEHYLRLFLAQIDLRNCSFARIFRGQLETIHIVQGEDRSGEVAFSAKDGTVTLNGYVISLSHRRIAEVLAWWVPGCRGVINQLEIAPPEEDSDDEITDAVQLALEIDPFQIHADQIGISTKAGCVELQGVATSENEKQRAEFDAWCIPGVASVKNYIEVRH